MRSVISKNYQVTIPKTIRRQFKLSAHDPLIWRIENGQIVLHPVKTNVLLLKGCVHVGAGDVAEDIEQARLIRARDAQ